MSLHSLQLTNVSMTIFHLTDMNTIILNNNGSILMLHERDRLPEFMLGAQQKDFLLLSLETKLSAEQCCIYTNDWGLSYIAKVFDSKGGQPKALVIGPFLLQVPDTNRFLTKTKIDQQKHIELKAFYRGLKLVSSSRIQSLANILDSASSIGQASLRFLDIHQHTQNSSQQTDIVFMLQKPEHRDTELIKLRYKIEKEMMHIIEKGDKAGLKQILSKMNHLFDFSERFPNQPIRAMKNAAIVLNTLLRIAAENGKVQPYYLHQISEKFSKQIERCETIDSLNNLKTVMYDEYCDLVCHRALSGYSPVIQKAAEYLTVHFGKPLNLGQLSEYCLVHPAHLSRQFKKESGVTLTVYQQKRRIEEAKILLQTDGHSIGWIAGFVGFDDAGFFTRIFKKWEGITPSEYRGKKRS